MELLLQASYWQNGSFGSTLEHTLERKGFYWQVDWCVPKKLSGLMK